MKKRILGMALLTSISLNASAGVEYEREGLVGGVWTESAGGTCPYDSKHSGGKWKYVISAGMTEFAGPAGSGTTYMAITPLYLQNQVCDSAEAVDALKRGAHRW